MLFNSINFAFFLPIIFILYWFGTNKKLQYQNLLLFAASYFFYACWDPRFLFLLAFSTLLDYYTGIRMSEAKFPNHRKYWFWLSIFVNLAVLGVFKYYNFFASSFAEASAGLGLHVSPVTLSLILPLGISFYTFHGLSYIIDIYNGRIKAEKNFVNYAVFVSFFPLLVAGPIERATHLLPQIKAERVFDYSKAADGLRQILWGLFKKIVIADQCAFYVNIIFDNPGDYSGSTLVIGAVFFAFQIYCDFSGYSDIAIGTARLFGIELLRNFAYPYFSRNIAEFWRRWHISLSTWFRDYLYIPLGGSKRGMRLTIRNIFIIFIVSGFWHGANWTFIIWGFLHALFILPSVILKTNRAFTGPVAAGKYLPTLKEFFSMLITFSLTTVAWIFFRSETPGAAFDYISQIFSVSFFNFPEIFPKTIFLLLLFFLVTEWHGRAQQFALAKIGFRLPRVFRWAFYYILIFTVYYFAGTAHQFIYFQF